MSFSSEALRIGAKVCKLDKVVDKWFHEPPRNTGAMQVDKFDKRLELEQWDVKGFKIITLKMKNSLDSHVIVLHGGAYTMEAVSTHRKIMEIFARDGHLKVSFIDYPLAPENSASTTLSVVFQAYQEIATRNKGDQFCLFGDSAGGGLALALLQMLRDNGIKPFPIKTALQSPWLDVTMSNKKVKEVKKYDPILSIQGLIDAGKQYAGDMDTRDPLISPLFGNLGNLGSVLLLAGTHEVFLPDCELLNKKLSKSAGSTVEFHIIDKMVHDWVIMPIKEAKQTIMKIVDFYNK